MRVPTAQLVAVAGPTVRAIRWTQPALTLGIALGLVLWRADTLNTPTTAVWTVRAAALVVIAGALAVLDDPAAPQVAAVPLPLSWRTAPRILVALTLVTVPVAALAGHSHLPLDGLILEAGAVLALAAAGCLLLARAGILEPSMPVGVGLLLAPAALFLLPDRMTLLAAPGPIWAQSHARWAWLFGLGIITLALALRDPARPCPTATAERWEDSDGHSDDWANQRHVRH